MPVADADFGFVVVVVFEGVLLLVVVVVVVVVFDGFGWFEGFESVFWVGGGKEGVWE